MRGLSVLIYLRSLFLIGNLFSNSFASTDLKLIDFMLDENATIKILQKYEIKEKDALLIRNYLTSSLTALGLEKSSKRKEFKDIFAKLPPTKIDINVHKDLQILFDKSENEIKKEDIMATINNIIYLANKHGTNVIIACAECVNENLAKSGFKFTIETITNPSSLKILNNILLMNSSELATFISTEMRKLKMGDYTKILPNIIDPIEEKTLALFLGLAENGTADQKELIASIKKLSTKNGKINLIDPNNQHKFWKLLAIDMNPQDMANWTKTLNEIASLAAKTNTPIEKAFYLTLKERSQGNEYLTKQYEALKLRRCFFK